MKKIVHVFKYLTLILGFFLFSNVANAELQDSYTKLPYVTLTTVDYYRKNPSSGWITVHNYHQKVETNGVGGRQDDDQDIFCLDMALHGSSTLYAFRDITADNPDRPFDKGIIYIATADADYRAKLTAIRAYSAMIPEYRRFYVATDSYGVSMVEQYAALLNSATEWAAELDNETLKAALGMWCYDHNFYTDPDTPRRDHVINHLFGANMPSDMQNTSFQQHLSNGSSRTVDGIFHKSGRLNESNPVIQQAKSLFQEAIRVSASGDAGTDNKKITFPNEPSKFTDKITGVPTPTYDGVTTTREISFQISFTNFHENKQNDLRLDINPDTDNSVQLRVLKMYYKKIGETEWHEFNSSFDFLPIITNQTETFDIKVLVRTTQRVGESVGVNFRITPSYETRKLGKARMYSSNSDGQHQRFIIAEPGGYGPNPVDFRVTWGPDICTVPPNTSSSEEYKMYLDKCCFADGSGASFEEKCSRGDTNACSKYDQYCRVCEGSVSIPQQCTEFAGGEVPQCTDGADAVVNGPNNIKLCVLENDTYNLSRDNAANQYCKIYCKEDYKIGMPLGKWVESGKSFTMDVTINGTKTCYTSEIQYQQFLNDLTNVETVIKADQDEVARLQKIADAADAATEVFGNSTLEAFARDEMGMALTIEKDGNSYCQKTSAKYVDPLSQSDCPNGYVKITPRITENNPDVTIDKVRQGVHTKLENAKNKLNGDIKDYARRQSDYNSCSTLYNNNKGIQDNLFKIKTNEEVIFEYQENYRLDKGTNTSKLTKKVTGDYPGTAVLDTTWFCDSEVDDFYNVCKGNATTQGTQQVINHPDCLNNSCDLNNWDSNKAVHPTTTVIKTKYGKITSRYAALYVPTTEFAADLSGIKKSKADIEALIAVSNPSDLGKKGYSKIVRKVYVNGEAISQEVFPIKLNTDKGAYSYDVKFSGIGEHYNTGATGRLIGDADSVVSKAKGKFTGKYVCSYIIDCKNCRAVPSSSDPYTKPGYTIEEPGTSISTYFDKSCKGCSVIWPGTGETKGSPIVRQISLNNVNPSDRGLGYNLLNTKGITATKEIESKGEEIYKTEVYSITLTPNVINFINEYVNKNKSGSIPINSLKDRCKNYSDAYGTNKSKEAVSQYDYLICESGLLDELEGNKDAKVKNNITYTSWIDSEYCSKNECVIGAGFGYGNVFGPAYK